MMPRNSQIYLCTEMLTWQEGTRTTWGARVLRDMEWGVFTSHPHSTPPLHTPTPHPHSTPSLHTPTPRLHSTPPLHAFTPHPHCSYTTHSTPRGCHTLSIIATAATRHLDPPCTKGVESLCILFQLLSSQRAKCVCSQCSMAEIQCRFAVWSSGKQQK